jgi:hypothetical protein
MTRASGSATATRSPGLAPRMRPDGRRHRVDGGARAMKTVLPSMFAVCVTGPERSPAFHASTTFSHVVAFTASFANLSAAGRVVELADHVGELRRVLAVHVDHLLHLLHALGIARRGLQDVERPAGLRASAQELGLDHRGALDRGEELRVPRARGRRPWRGVVLRAVAMSSAAPTTSCLRARISAAPAGVPGSRGMMSFVSTPPSVSLSIRAASALVCSQLTVPRRCAWMRCSYTSERRESAPARPRAC